MKRIIAVLLSLIMCCGCSKTEQVVADAVPFVSRFERENIITLSDSEIKLNGEAVGEEGDVFVSHDIIYYEDKEAYDSGFPYGEGEENEKHTLADAEANTVLNITKSGSYRISGKLSAGQIRVDLGENAYNNPDAIVELILDNADITCDLAPAILFMNVYECDNEWSVENAKYDVDTTNAGAILVLADGSVNNISGSHVAKIFKDQEDEKKLWKQDGAVYSYMSMNVYGPGALNLVADNEGMDTELHLTINGGNINIYSQNDGINTNEDGVSVTTINGGNVHIIAGLGAEGDGIDSNGWLVINGGNIVASANPAADAGLDSDLGSFINGGTVVALGSTMDWPESESEQVTMNLQFAQYQNSDNAIVVTDESGKVVFAYDPSRDEIMGNNVRNFSGAVISSPNLEVESGYLVYTGGTISGEEIGGVYDVVSITDYKDGVQQAYSGTDLMRGPGGRMNGAGAPPQMPEGERPQMPRPDMPQGERPEMPRPEMSEGERREMPRPEMSEGDRPKIPNGEQEGIEQKTVFYMTDKVNLFSGVTEYK